MEKAIKKGAFFMEEKNYKKIIQAIRDLDIEELRKENTEEIKWIKKSF